METRNVMIISLIGVLFIGTVFFSGCSQEDLQKYMDMGKDKLDEFTSDDSSSEKLTCEEFCEQNGYYREASLCIAEDYREVVSPLIERKAYCNERDGHIVCRYDDFVKEDSSLCEDVHTYVCNSSSEECVCWCKKEELCPSPNEGTNEPFPNASNLNECTHKYCTPEGCIR